MAARAAKAQLPATETLLAEAQQELEEQANVQQQSLKALAM